MSVDVSKFVFPLEDAYIGKQELFADGFYYVKSAPNGVLVKAPFDCVVKQAFKKNETDYLPGAFNTLLSEPYDVYEILYESKDGQNQFSVSGILPNDRSRNIGAAFKAGENIGRTLAGSSGFAYKFYEAVITNPEAPRKEQKTEFAEIDPDKVQQNTTESEAAEAEAKKFKMPSRLTLLVVASFALTAFYIAKRYK